MDLKWYLVSPRMDDKSEADLELRLFDSLLSSLGLFPALFLAAIKLSLLFVALLMLLMFLLPLPPTAVTLALLAALTRAKATKSEESP